MERPAPLRPSYARPTPPKMPPKTDDASLSSIIDTIEAIIIALILALTFRAFIIEAFVIPTGSMAPTLLGAHFNVICPECGYTFTRDASLEYQLVGKTIGHTPKGELVSNTNIPCDGNDTSALFCPNCQYIIPYYLLPQALKPVDCVDGRRDNRPRKDVPFAWANNGDRILVLKYVYSLMEPTRFDVIVFKEPMRARDNFIKRLIGLPGETIEIIGGDVFVGPPGKNAPEDRVIARKPVHLQKDLWQLVYDNDFYPRDEGPPVRGAPPISRAAEAQSDQALPHYYREWHNPWIGAGPTAAAWNKPGAATADGQPFQTIGGPVVHYTSSTAGTLQFNPAHREPYLFNILGYNNDIHDLYHGRGGTLQPVGDLRLETTWTPTESAGESISLTVGLPHNQFRATWSTSGLEVWQFNAETEKFVSMGKVAAGDLPTLAPGKAYHVALNNVDHSAQFFIDGKMVFSFDVPWNAREALTEDDWVRSQIEQKSSKLEALAPKVEIEVGGACTLGHLKLWRDLYYTQSEAGPGARDPGAAKRGHPLTLGQDEFFALGDNSRRSHDGRTWNEVFPALDDLGTMKGIVPRRYLLGKAIFVYWPAGYRFTDSLPHVPPLVPNTGDMRFIR